MNHKFKELIPEIAEKLIEKIVLFIEENFNEEEKISDLINFVLSAYLTAVFRLMRVLADGDKEAEEKVNKFTDSITSYISTLSMIQQVEVFPSD